MSLSEMLFSRKLSVRRYCVFGELMAFQFDTRDTKPKLRALQLLTAAAVVIVVLLALTAAERAAAASCIVIAVYAGTDVAA